MGQRDLTLDDKGEDDIYVLHRRIIAIGQLGGKRREPPFGFVNGYMGQRRNIEF